MEEEQEVANGWPLGLENMSTRLRVTESLPAASAAGPYISHMMSSSFSSFSSSDLDTESTASFFQDKSTSLGRLIGIRPGNRGRLYLTDSRIWLEQHQRGSHLAVSQNHHGMETSSNICVPLLLSVMAKMSRSKSNSRH